LRVRTATAARQERSSVVLDVAVDGINLPVDGGRLCI